MKIAFLALVLYVFSFSALACMPVPAHLDINEVNKNTVYKGPLYVDEVKYIPNSYIGYFILKLRPYVFPPDSDTPEFFEIIDEQQCIRRTWKRGEKVNFIIYKDKDYEGIYKATHYLASDDKELPRNHGDFCISSFECDGVCLDKIREQEDQTALLKERYESYKQEFLRRQNNAPKECMDEDQRNKVSLFCDKYEVLTFEKFSEWTKAGICSDVNDCVTDINGFKFNCTYEEEN